MKNLWGTNFFWTNIILGPIFCSQPSFLFQKILGNKFFSDQIFFYQHHFGKKINGPIVLDKFCFIKICSKQTFHQHFLGTIILLGPTFLDWKSYFAQNIFQIKFLTKIVWKQPFFGTKKDFWVKKKFGPKKEF